MEELQIRRLLPDEYPLAREIVLAGLQEHWGRLDPALNPDLDDMPRHYQLTVFLGAFHDGTLLGVGALTPEGADTGRIERMSVVAGQRRKGVGQQLLHALLHEARQAGYRRVVLETTATWEDARRLYTRNGFQLVAIRDGDAHYELALN